MNLTPHPLVAAEFPHFAHLPLTNPAVGRPPVPGLYLRKTLANWTWAVWTGRTWRAGHSNPEIATDLRRYDSNFSEDIGAWVGLAVDPQRGPQRVNLLSEAIDHLRTVLSPHTPPWGVFYTQRQAARDWLQNLPADLA